LTIPGLLLFLFARPAHADHSVYLDYVVSYLFPLGAFNTRYEHPDTPLSVGDAVLLKEAMSKYIADYALADLPDGIIDLREKYTYISFVFDQELLRVVVEIAPQHLKRIEISPGRRPLSGSAKGNAHVANVNISHTRIETKGADGAEVTRAGYSVVSRVREYVSNARGNVSKTAEDSSHNLQEVTLARDFREHYFTLGSGLFDGSGYFDAQQKKMIGTYLTRNYRLDPNLKVNDQTSIDVVLDRVATIEVEVQGQIIYRRRFDPGNYVVQGLAIPQRFDSVVIRKIFLDGTEEEETQAFFRSSEVFPPGYYDLNVYAGVEYDTQEYQGGASVLQLDGRVPVIEGLNIGGFLQAVDRKTSIGAGAYHAGPFGKTAYEATFARAENRHVSLSHRLRYEKYWPGIGVRTEAERLDNRSFDDEERAGSMTLRLIVDHTLSNWNILHTFTREIEEDGGGAGTTYGVNASRRVWRNGTFGLSFRHDTQSDETSAMARLTWVLDNVTGTVSYSDEGGNEQTISGKVGPGRAYFSRQQAQERISRQIRYNGDTEKGTLEVAASEVSGEGSENRVYSGFYAGALSLLDGSLYWHRPTTGSYAIATFDDDSKAAAESYDILVDGSIYERNVTADNVYIGPLPDFIQSKITFIPNAAGLFDTAKPFDAVIDNQRRTGVHIPVSVRLPANITGRIVRDDGEPVRLFSGTVKAATGKATAYIFTGDGGEFLIEQAELEDFHGILRGKGAPCRIELDLRGITFPDPSKPLADIGVIKCGPVQ